MNKRDIGIALSIISVFLTPARSAQPVRITQSIDNNRRVTLLGHLNPRAQAGTDQGRVDLSLALPYVTLMLKPSAAQQADLEQFLAQQQDPSSSNYHRWLTPEEYADRFGVSQRYSADRYVAGTTAAQRQSCYARPQCHFFQRYSGTHGVRFRDHHSPLSGK